MQFLAALESSKRELTEMPYLKLLILYVSNKIVIILVLV